MSSGQSGQVRAVTGRLLLLERPAPCKAHDAALAAARVHDEVERVVELMVDRLAALVRQAEPKMEAAVRERQRADLEADAALSFHRGPAELAQVDRLAGDERAGVVSQLELEPRRRRAVVSGDGHAERERLSGEELQALGSLLPDERRRGDRNLARPPLAEPCPALGRVDVVREGAAVARDRLASRAVEGDAPRVEEHRALAEPLDRGRVVRDEDDGAAVLLEREDPPEALPLERLVADGEDLVEEEDVGIEESGDGEAEAHGHPGRVRADRPVDRVLELGEGDDLVEALADVRAAQALDRAVQVNVLATGEVGVEAGAELEQRSDPALGADAARRRLDDPRDDPKQGRLPRAVPADEADRLAARDVHRDVAERPDVGRLAAASLNEEVLERSRVAGVETKSARDTLDADFTRV